MPKRILVVDDNGANLDLMVYLLQAHGYSVTAASDGLRALEETGRTRYDLILCDIRMPGIDGFEVLRRFRESGSGEGCKFIAVTALAMVGDKERILASGFDGYIAKPIEPEHFIEQLAQFLPPEEESAVASQPEPTAVHSALARREGPLILAVDDVPVNIEVVRGSLEPFGFRVQAAHNALEALERCAHELPDLILCDLHMPHGDGFSFIAQVKASDALADIPFLFISSTTWHSSEKQRAIEMGALKFLHRPMEPRALLVEVKKALAAK